MDKQKNSLLDALVRLAGAQADCIIRGDGDDEGEALPDVTLPELDATMQEIQKWADLNDSKVNQVSLKHATAHKHYGRALKILQKQMEDKSSKDLDKKAIELYTHLGWDHCSRYTENWLPVKYPHGYRPF